MTVNPGPLAKMVAEFMDDLEREYGEDAVIRDAMVVVEVRSPVADAEDEDDLESSVEARVLSASGVSGIGLAVRSLQAMMDPD